VSPHPYDLQLRAAVAARSLTGLVDTQRDGLMYSLASWQSKPPRAEHCLWDCGDGSGRHVDALTLARRAVRSGSDAEQPNAAGVAIEAWMMRLLGADGLSWLPTEPWARPWNHEALLLGYSDGEPVAEVSWAQRGTLLGLTSRYQATGEERYSWAGRRLVEGLLRIAEQAPDGLHFPEGYYRPSGWHSRSAGLSAGLEEYNAAIPVAAVRFFCATGVEAAIRLADGLARFALRHTTGYAPDGRLIGEPGSGLQDHFHTRSNFIPGVLGLGIAAGDRGLIEWAREAYERARSLSE